MEQVKAILINSREKLVQEVFMTNKVKEHDFFREAYKVMGVKIDYEVPELDSLDSCTNHYDENINFHIGHHNVFYNQWNNGWGSHIKTNNPEIFITPLKAKHTYLYGKILIVGEVKVNEDQTIVIYPLKFTVEEVVKSLEWRFKKKERMPRMSESEKQAEVEEIIMRRIQRDGYY